MIILGTGTSVGVPVIGCNCDVCTSGDPGNQRTRCAVVFELPEGLLLVDTPPDLRHQLLREGIGHADAIFFTHAHADHLHGLDDVRLFPFKIGCPVPIYCEPRVKQRIERVFDYAFLNDEGLHPGAVPKLKLQEISTAPFEALGALITPIRVLHGGLPVLGLRIGNCAYCTDVSAIPEESLPLLRDLDVLVIDALRPRSHPTHFSVEEALQAIAHLKPRRALLTHMSHEIDARTANSWLPQGVELAYDGMQIPLA